LIIKISQRIELVCYERFLKRHFPYLHEDACNKLNEYFIKHVYCRRIQHYSIGQQYVDYDQYHQMIGMHPESVVCIENEERYIRNCNVIKFSVWLLHNRDFVEMIYL
jgi:hypothetical protein